MAVIYKDNFIEIHNPIESGVPGFYTIEPVLLRRSVVDLNDTEFRLFIYMQKLIRASLKTKFNIELCGLYCEEHSNKPVVSYTIPFHIDRLTSRFSVDVYQPYIAEYLKSYPHQSKESDTFNNGLLEIFNLHEIKRDIEQIKQGKRIQSQDFSDPEPLTLKKKPKIEKIVEVFDESEIPPVPKGKKYFVCIGGSKNFQGFLSDSSMSKGEFIFTHEDKLDDCLRPILEDNQIVVRQDAKYAIPGFYIVSPKTHYRRIDEMPYGIYEKCMRVARKVRGGLLTLGVNQAHIYHDEKYKSPASAHFWVLPIDKQQIEEKKLNPTIFSHDIWTYLETFPRFKETKFRIIEFNKKMEQYLRTNGLKQTNSES